MNETTPSNDRTTMQIEARPTPQLDGWQPISTVPQGKLVETTTVNDALPVPHNARVLQRARGSWWTAQGTNVGRFYQPTHWRERR